MRTKLQDERYQQTWSRMGSGMGGDPEDPHLVYANHDFGSQDKDAQFEEMVEYLDNNYISSGQELYRSEQDLFRQCLEWLAAGASIEVDDLISGTRDEQLTEAVGAWSSDPRIRFLELHALKHPSGGGLAPGLVRSKPWRCLGLAFKQGVAKDPLDMLCWHIITLYLDGRLTVRKCRYAKCQKFFDYRRNIRRVYCQDKCRARDQMKSREAMRLYMREYRRIKRTTNAKSQKRGESWLKKLQSMASRVHRDSPRN